MKAVANIARCITWICVLLTSSVSLATPPAMRAHPITSPEQSFGFKPGTDRKLADWQQLVAYYRRLAAESDRVQLRELGKTTEGRPFIALAISTPENLAHLAEYQDITRRLSDARVTTPAQAQDLIRRGKIFLVVTCNIHAEEMASSQTAAEFAYRLASGRTPGIRSILENVILILIPSLNPDGEQLVVDWYKKYLGTPYEGASPVVLWAHYVGHDDNRDWYSFTQQETRLTVGKVLNAFHPQILFDLHETGTNDARVTLPPFVDPVDPNIDPLLFQSIGTLGMEAALAVSRSGRQGVVVHGAYDLWSPARCYVCYHDTLRLFMESATVHIATPVVVPFEKLDRGIGYDAKVSSWNSPSPWPGGTWSIGDIVRDQLAASFAVATHAALYRERYLEDYYTIARHQLTPKNAPYAYVIPSGQEDPAVVARLINILRLGEVEVQQATSDFTIVGHPFPRGSFIVPLAQPFGAFAKTLLEAQHYPDIREYPGGPPARPYDVTAHTLPLLFGVETVAIPEKPAVDSAPVTEAKLPPTPIPADAPNGYLIDDHSNSSLYALFTLLGKGFRAYRLTDTTPDPGMIYVPAQAGLGTQLRSLTGRFPLRIKAAPAVPAGHALAITLPRIALYQSWIPSMDEGWTRWIFDQNDIPYTRVVDADLRAGDLRKRFDVILVPDNDATAIASGYTYDPKAVPPEPPVPPEYQGGMGVSGLAALDDFVHAGGTLIALNEAAEVFAKRQPDAVTDILADVEPKDFYIPGSILEAQLDSSHPIGFGSATTLPVFFQHSPAFAVKGPAKAVARYSSEHPLLSGWIRGGERLSQAVALADVPLGRGHLILFGFRPQYRAQSEVTYKLLFNAMLYATEIPVSLGDSP